MDGKKPYVILLGGVGTGKSTLVEKVTKESGISSASSTSKTKSSNVIEAYDGSLIICDTPGTDSIIDKFHSNLQVAHALNFMNVSLVLLTVKADVRIESVIKGITEFMECFDPEEFPIKLIRFCIKHMDTVSWNKDELTKCLKNDFGIEKTVFSYSKKENDELIQEIKNECLKHPSERVNVNSEMFSKLFQDNDYEIKISREI